MKRINHRLLQPVIAVPILVVALLLGVSYGTSQTIKDTVSCIDIAGCDMSSEQRGDLTVSSRGLPASYYTVRSFTLTKGGNMSSTQPLTPFNPAILVSNVVFWIAVGVGAYYAATAAKSAIDKKRR